MSERKLLKMAAENEIKILPKIQKREPSVMGIFVSENLNLLWMRVSVRTRRFF